MVQDAAEAKFEELHKDLFESCDAFEQVSNGNYNWKRPLTQQPGGSQEAL